MKYLKMAALMAAAMSLMFLTACGSGKKKSFVNISITQPSNIRVGDTATLTVDVTRTNNPDFTVAATPTGSGCAKGTGANANKVNCTPTAAGLFTITVTSVADKKKTATASLVVTPAVTISITAAQPMKVGETQILPVTINNAGTNTDFTVAATPAGSGCVRDGGNVKCIPTAASATGYTITVTSAADTRRTNTTTLVVTPAVAIAISQTAGLDTITMGTGSLTYNVTVSNATNTSFSLQVNPATGSGCAPGTTDGTVVCANPTVVGDYVIRVTAAADSTKFAETTLHVTAPAAASVSINPTTATMTLGGAPQVFIVTPTNTPSFDLTALPAAGCVKGTGADANKVTCTPTAASPATGYSIVVTASSDSTKSDTATLIVNAAAVVSVSINPTTATMKVGDPAQVFTVTLTNTPGFDLTALPAAGCVKGTGADALKVTCTPTAADTYTLTVAASTDSMKTATATLTVNPAGGGGDTPGGGANKKPAELAAWLPFDDGTAFGGAPSPNGGLWSARAPSTYNPALDALSIPGNAYVYFGFSWATFSPLPVPPSIDGYEMVDPASVPTLQSGQWAVAALDGYNYAIIVPKYEKPLGLAAWLPFDDGTAFGGAPSPNGGLWSARAPSTYNPALDALSIPGNAYVYFGFSWATFSPLPVPPSIDGYEMVDPASVPTLQSGQWAVAAIDGYNYAIIVPGGFVE